MGLLGLLGVHGRTHHRLLISSTVAHLNMYYNNTKVPISIPFHEDLFLRSYLSTEMWPLDYYELLELIGDDYE